MSYKKLFLFSGAGFIFAAILFSLFIMNVTSSLCEQVIIKEASSPNKKVKAIVFAVDCGATTSVNTQVTLVKNESNSTKKDLKNSFFIADANHNKAPTESEGELRIQMHWATDSELHLSHHALARIFRQDTHQDNIAFKYSLEP